MKIYNWSPDFMKRSFYDLKQPYVFMAVDELFDGNRVRDENLGLAKTVIRENDRNPVRMDYPAIHPKIWGMRYTLDAGYADYILPNYGVPMMVIVSGEPMKRLMLELVREIAILVDYPAPDHWIDIADDGKLWSQTVPDYLAS